MVGYKQGSKAYRLFNPETEAVITSRDVVFMENETSKVTDYNCCDNHFYFFVEDSSNKIEVEDLTSPVISCVERQGDRSN